MFVLYALLGLVVLALSSFSPLPLENLPHAERL